MRPDGRESEIAPAFAAKLFREPFWQFCMQLAVRIAKPILALIVAAAVSFAQTPAAGDHPERAYLSPEKYTNAFFGFALTLPPGTDFAVMPISAKMPKNFLFGLEARQSRLTGIEVFADESAKPSADAVKTAIFREDSRTKKIKVDGKEFWRSQSQQETAFGKQEFIGYGFAVDGYIVHFQIVSVDPELTAELEQMVQSLIFFDPANSREIAGAGSRPYPIDEPAIKAANEKIAEIDPGVVAGSTYSNSYFGLSYRFPGKWNVADKTAREKIAFTEHRADQRPDAASPGQQLAAHCTRVLLWAAKYPQAKSGDEFDPFILVSVADPACLPVPVSFPTSIHDQAGLQAFTQTLLQSLTGTALLGAPSSGVIKARAINLNGHLFIELPTVALTTVPGSRLYKKIHMSLTITEVRNYWLMWTFASDSLSELHAMMKTNIVFAPSARTGESIAH